MGFREVGGGRNYKPFKNWESGDYVAGIYRDLGTDQFDNPTYVIEVDDTNIEEFPVGENAGLNSCGSLNYKMENIKIGQRILVEYLREGIAKKGKFAGKPQHELKVCVDDSFKPELMDNSDPDCLDYDDINDGLL